MPNHSLLRLAAKLHNTPHLITTNAFNVVLDYLDTRNGGVQLLAQEAPVKVEDESNSTNGLTVIRVDGSLSYKPVMTMCGEAGTSYSALVSQVEEAINEGSTTIVLEVSSGGGEASHVFQAAEDIRTMCNDANVKLLAYADTMSCSAAYALSVIADVLVVNPSAIVGSIGCVVCLLDSSKAMEQAGMKRIFITSGEAKVPYDDKGAFKSEFLASIQKDVDRLNKEFAEFVSKYSGIETETIMAMQANTFNAQEALENGLADKIMTNKEFAAYAVSVHKGAPYA